MQKALPPQQAEFFPNENIDTKSQSYFEMLIGPQCILHY